MVDAPGLWGVGHHLVSCCSYSLSYPTNLFLPSFWAHFPLFPFPFPLFKLVHATPQLLPLNFCARRGNAPEEEIYRSRAHLCAPVAWARAAIPAPPSHFDWRHRMVSPVNVASTTQGTPASSAASQPAKTARNRKQRAGPSAQRRQERRIAAGTFPALAHLGSAVPAALAAPALAPSAISAPPLAPSAISADFRSPAAPSYKDGGVATAQPEANERGPAHAHLGSAAPAALAAPPLAPSAISAPHRAMPAAGSSCGMHTRLDVTTSSSARQV